MALDVYDPGPDGRFPHLPRRADGTVDRGRVDLGPPMPTVRVWGVETRLDDILNALDDDTRQGS